MEETKKYSEVEPLDIDILDNGIENDSDIGTRGFCCGATLFPIRFW